jgi:chemotaxis protein CheD
MANVTPVAIGKVETGKSPEILAVYGIGSCVIVAMYDQLKKIGGLAHIMLPVTCDLPTDKSKLNRYADHGVTQLLELLLKRGCRKNNLVAKIAGGSKMFSTTCDYENNVGCDNIRSVKSILAKLKVDLVFEDTGGNKGRSVEFDLETGELNIYLLDENSKEE